MFNWLLGIDIMGGGASAPEDMPIQDKSIFGKIANILPNLILYLAIIGIIFYIFVLIKNSNNKDK